MKNNESQPNPAAAPVAVVVPPAFAAHDKSLNDSGLAYAVQLGEKHPAIVKAAIEFQDVYNRAGEKFFGFASALREAKLLKKEATLLLLGLGLSKSRTSEMIKLSSVSDEVWAKYSAKAVGFRAALALEDGKSSTGGTEEDGEEGEGTTTRKNEKKAPLKIHDIPEKSRVAFLDACKAFSRPLKGGKPTEYALACTHDGVNFYIALSVSAKG